MESTTAKEGDLPKQIRITDPSVIRKVVNFQHREQDRTPTKTASKVIDRYFAIVQATPASS